MTQQIQFYKHTGYLGLILASIFGVGAVMVLGIFLFHGLFPAMSFWRMAFLLVGWTIGYSSVVGMLLFRYSYRNAQRLLQEIDNRQQAQHDLQQRHRHTEVLVAEQTTELESINRQLQAEIAEHQRTEEALHQSEEQYRSLFENLQDIFYRTDCDGNLRLVSPSIIQLLGYSQDEATRLNLKNDIFSDPERWTAFVRFVEENRYLEQFEIPLKRCDGSLIWGSFKSQWHTDQSGKILGIEGLIRDITDRKHVEEALQRAKEVAEAAQRDTEQALRAAESANQAKSEFLANMSHELRTPLNSILGYAQVLLRQQTLTAEQRDMLEIIGRSGEHLLMMINHVLDLSRIEAGKMELIPTEFSLPGLVEMVGEIARIQAQQKEIALTYQIDPQLFITVNGDETRLRQILLNLLGNAVKFTETGSVTFSVTSQGKIPITTPPPTNQSIHGRHTIRFEIADTGMGIPAEALQEIFEPFRQVRDRRNQTKGIGLGLSISRKLVRMMNSELHVTSQVNVGSRFWFEVQLPEGHQVVPFHKTLNQMIVGVKGRSYHVLVVDDDEDNVLVLKRLLEPLGFTVSEATNGQKALEYVQSHQPDIIVMDLVMPLMDGFETTRRIREMERRKQEAEGNESEPHHAPVPILAISANAFDLTRQKSLAAGCNDFLTKPLQIYELLERLTTHLNLEWVYASEEALSDRPEGQPTADHGATSSRPIPVPPPEALMPLLELIRRGDLLSLPEQASRIAQWNPQYAPYVAKICQFAQTFQIDELEMFITHSLP